MSELRRMLLSRLSWFIGSLVASCLMGPVSARGVPPLREQVSLAGAWDLGGTVPNYRGDRFDRRTYQRRVAVPPTWNGKHIEIEFSQVNYAARVYVDHQLVGEHVGGWVTFAIDVTPHVKAGAEFVLRVEVTSSTLPPYVDDQRKPLWPVGTYNHDGSYAGIIDDVWLRAYGSVAIHDAFIRTSHRTNTIEVEYSLVNHDTSPRTIRLNATAIPWHFSGASTEFSGEPITLQGGESRVVTLRKSWPEAVRWFPDQPHQYCLQSSVVESNHVIDAESRLLGFREITIEGNQYVLNGVRVNLWGDSIPRSWTDAKRITPEAWPATVDMLKNDLNLRIIRWHQFPPADYLLDVADEKGLLIIEESALYARPWTHANQQTVTDNMKKTWIPEWVRAHRNHPSIVLWSAENEDYKHVGGFQPDQLHQLSDVITSLDPTRPVIHDGDEDLAGLAKTFNWHYPEGYEKLPRGSIYSWAGKVHPSKPTGIGEFLACPWVKAIQPEVFWWHGTWSRGLRYTNFTDIRPFVMTWAWGDEQPEAKANLRRSFSPVALFDKAYDDLGIEPLMTGQYPELEAGSRIERALVLYNDDYRGTKLSVEAQLVSDGKALASTKREYELPLGEHRDLPIVVQLPRTTGVLELVLTVRKNGQPRFSEVKRFRLTEGQGTAAVEPLIEFGDLVPSRVPRS